MQTEGTQATLLAYTDMAPTLPSMGVDDMPWIRPPQSKRDTRVGDDAVREVLVDGGTGVMDDVSKDVPPDMTEPTDHTPAGEPPATTPKRKRGRPAKEGTAPRRTVKRVENRPESEQRHLADVARYLWRLRADLGMTNEEIAAEAAKEVPGITQFTVSKLVSPTYITQVGSPLYLTIRAVLHALGSSFTDMERALSELPPGLSEEAQRQSEVEHSLSFLLRRMSPTHAEILLQTARMFSSADSVGTTGTSIEAAERAKSGMTWNEFWDSEQGNEQGGNNASGSHPNRNTDRKIQ